MPTFEIEMNGKSFEVDAPTHQAALGAIGSMSAQPSSTAPAAQNPAPQKSESMGWGDVASGALSNAWPSVKNLAVNTVTPILHPIETAKTLGNIGLGAVEKLIPGGEYPHEKHADAVGKFFADRYGGVENVKKTMAEDPAGFLADLSTVLTGGGALAARVPGAAGAVTNAVSTAGRAIDPFMLAAKAVKGGAKLGTDVIGNLGTNTGGQSIRTAYGAGVKGGEAGEAFRDNLRGAAPLEEVVTDAKAAVSNMRKDRGAEYNAGMSGIRADTKVLDFSDIDQAVAKANNVKTFKGQELSKSTAGVRKDIDEAISNWKGLDPAEYHTAAGLDALKQSIGDIKESLPFNTPQRAVADQVYNAVRETIVKQAPEYAKTMKGYETASKQIGEIERTLSLGRKATTDTALRKLQSVTRNNVNTNYGKRAELAEVLANSGAPNLMEKLAGQANATWTPRGLGKVVAPLVGGSAFINPMAAAALPVMSPRLVAEVAHALGRGVGAVTRPAAKALPAAIKGGKTTRAALIADLLAGRTENAQQALMR